MSARRDLLTMAVLALASACDPVAIADITIALRQPAERDLVDEADAIALDSMLDGRDVGKEVRDPSPGDLTFSIELAASDEGEEQTHAFRTSLRARKSGATFALGRSAEVKLPSIAQVRADETARRAIRLPLLLGPTDAPATLNASAPSTRRRPAVCANDAGRAWVLGGVTGPEASASAVATGFVFDEDKLDVDDEGISIATDGWADGDCLIDEDGTPILFGGCRADDSALNLFHRLVDGELEELPIEGVVDAGCGARMRHGGEGMLWWVNETSAVLRRASDGTEVLRATGFAARRGPFAATTRDGDLVLSGGVDMGEPLHDAVGVRADSGVVFPLPTLVDAVLLDFGGDEAPYALNTDGTLFVVARNANSFSVDEERTLELQGIVPEQLLSLGDGRLAVLGSQSGSRQLLVEHEDGTSTVYGVTRDRMLAGPGGSVLLVGGDAPGIDVVMAR